MEEGDEAAVHFVGWYGSGAWDGSDAVHFVVCRGGSVVHDGNSGGGRGGLSADIRGGSGDLRSATVQSGEIFLLSTHDISIQELLDNSRAALVIFCEVVNTALFLLLLSVSLLSWLLNAYYIPNSWSCLLTMLSVSALMLYCMAYMQAQAI